MFATLALVVASAALQISAAPFFLRQASSDSISTPNSTIASNSTSATNQTSLPEYYFDQLIDHTNPSLGTFKQRYFFDDTYWKSQGSPIVIMNPGEQTADGFDAELTSKGSLQRAIMEAIGAAGVVMEHRYWGKSSPVSKLTTENMKYLFVDQAIEDTKYFVEHVELPWTKNATSHPDATPWVNMGCSYPGVLTAYTQEKYSDIFAAGWASSAPVQAQGDFWQYFEPIEEGMPNNCSADVALVVKHVDDVLLHGSDQEKDELKKTFGLEALKDDDFGTALSAPTGSWQEMGATSYNNSGEDPFFQWCDAVETLPNGANNTSADPVGLDTALTNYAKYFKAKFPDNDCPGEGGACYSTYNYTSDQYTNKSINNSFDLQWLWMVCTEFGWWQDGDPGNYSSIVSSMITQDYNLRQCNYMFPNADGSPGDFHPKISVNNAEHGGWNLRAERLFVVNGQFDPWRSASLSSKWAPQYENTPHMEVEVVTNGHHCWDWEIRGAKFEPDIKRVVDKGIATVRGWLNEWYEKHPNVANGMPVDVPNYWGDVLN